MMITKELYDKLSKLTQSILDERGRELPNPVPMELKIGTQKPESLRDQIRRIMRIELSKQAEIQGHETFEEADDFEVEDSFDMNEPNSQYEMMQEEFVKDDEVAPPWKSEESVESEKDKVEESSSNLDDGEQKEL